MQLAEEVAPRQTAAAAVGEAAGEAACASCDEQRTDEHAKMWDAASAAGRRAVFVRNAATCCACPITLGRMEDPVVCADGPCGCRFTGTAAREQEKQPPVRADSACGSPVLLPRAPLPPPPPLSLAAPAGFSYERAAITKWLLSHSTSPVTNASLPHRAVVPNVALRQLIEHLAEHDAAEAAHGRASRRPVEERPGLMRRLETQFLRDRADRNHRRLQAAGAAGRQRPPAVAGPGRRCCCSVLACADALCWSCSWACQACGFCCWSFLQTMFVLSTLLSVMLVVIGTVVAATTLLLLEPAGGATAAAAAGVAAPTAALRRLGAWPLWEGGVRAKRGLVGIPRDAASGRARQVPGRPCAAGGGAQSLGQLRLPGAGLVQRGRLINGAPWRAW